MLHNFPATNSSSFPIKPSLTVLTEAHCVLGEVRSESLYTIRIQLVFRLGHGPDGQVAGLPRLWSGFDPRSAHVEFVVKVAKHLTISVLK